ncbi:hypothetical protein ATANTOWER_019946, partial [Ataeniobius toweri]|nr:hypothetical protein [Ataeniobius toweri]
MFISLPSQSPYLPSTPVDPNILLITHTCILSHFSTHPSVFKLTCCNWSLPDYPSSLPIIVPVTLSMFLILFSWCLPDNWRRCCVGSGFLCFYSLWTQ